MPHDNSFEPNRLPVQGFGDAPATGEVLVRYGAAIFDSMTQLRFKAATSATVEPIDPSSASNAERIHAVQMAAYAQEAQLIGVTDFPPLHRTPEDVRSSTGRFLGAYVAEELVGIAGMESEGEADICISSFVVHPAWQRRGVGRVLLHRLCERYRSGVLSVETATRNIPALALYRQAGFTEARRWFVDDGSLELVRLHRRPANAQDVA